MKRAPLLIYLLCCFCFVDAQTKSQAKQNTSASKNSFAPEQVSSGTLVDIDGNSYQTITINHQTWMKENLKVTRYSNGDTIQTIKPDTINLDSIKAPKFQWAYNGDEKNVAIFGRLYTWYVVTDERNVCPSGWHVPTDDDFCILENSVEPGSDPNCNMQDHRGKNQGGYLKSAGLTYWREPNTGADNRSAFSVLPAGIRYSNGLFHSLGTHGYFWTQSEFDAKNGRSRRFYYDSKDVSRGAYYKGGSLSVRCLKN